MNTWGFVSINNMKSSLQSTTTFRNVAKSPNPFIHRDPACKKLKKNTTEHLCSSNKLISGDLFINEYLKMCVIDPKMIIEIVKSEIFPSWVSCREY